MKFLNDRRIEISHTIHLKIPNPINQVHLYFSLPPEQFNQRNIIIKRIDPPPTEIFNLEGNEVAFFKCETSIIVSIDYELTIFETFLERTEYPLNLITTEYKTFTRNQQLIQINDEIKTLAKNIIGYEKEPLNQAKLIYAWITENISYKKPSYNFGNLSALQSKKGDCGDMSFLFVSLCRALKIPARAIFGWWVIAPGKTGPHAWAECFIEQYGWIPVDCSVSSLIRKAKRTLGLFSGIDFYGLSKKKNYYFGNLDNKRVIYSIGSEFDAPYSYPDFMAEHYKKYKMDINRKDYIWGKISQANKILWLQPFFIHFEREDETNPVYPSFRSKLTIIAPIHERLLYHSHILSGIALFPSIIGLVFFHNPWFFLLSFLIHSTSALLLWKGGTRVFYLLALIFNFYIMIFLLSS